ncbi:hypothetical protein ACT7DH_15865 [Bacillus pacificus]
MISDPQGDNGSTAMNPSEYVYPPVVRARCIIAFHSIASRRTSWNGFLPLYSSGGGQLRWKAIIETLIREVVAMFGL